MSATITNNIGNTTVTTQYDPFGEEMTVTVTCEDGYSFDGDVTGEWNVPGDMLGEDFTLTVDSTNKTATGTFSSDTEDVEITLNGATKKDGGSEEKVTVVNNIENTTESHTIDGETVSITVTATKQEQPHYFINCVATLNDVKYQLTVDETTATVTIENVPTGGVITLTGSYRGVCSVDNQLTGCKVAGLKDYYLENETVSLTLTADDKTSFSKDKPPVLDYYSTNTVDSTSENFTVSEDSKTATVNFVLNYSSVEFSEITLTGGTTPDKEITGYGSINVYAVNDDILSDFSKARFIFSGTGETAVTPDGDLGDYVVELHKIFVPVGSTTKTTLKCGNTDTLIVCDSIDESVVSIDLGTVNVPHINGNTDDYLSEVQMFIPFKGFVKLSADIIGKTVGLTYKVDLVTGQGSYFVSADGFVIASDVVNCCSDVLYKTSKTKEVDTIGNLQANNSVLMGLEPFIIVKYYDSISNLTNNATGTVKIGECSGYCKFSKVFFESINCLKQEKESIERLLSTGVTI